MKSGVQRRPFAEVSLVYHHRNFGPQRHGMPVVRHSTRRRDGGAHTVETASCLSPSRGDHESVRFRASYEARVVRPRVTRLFAPLQRRFAEVHSARGLLR